MELKKSPNLVFTDYDLTKEYFSDEQDSIFSIKSEEIKKLDNPRALGISGHIRAKDEAYSIAQCIESCVEVFDELIITVQPFFNDSGIDETYEICKKYKEKYPDKIKLFYYTPEVGTISYFRDTKHYNPDGLPDTISDTSIHSFAHYCNFGLKEISYKYYMRVDADQIYLTTKLKKIREAIIYADRFAKPHRRFIDKALGRVFQPFYNLFRFILPLRAYICFMTWINKRCAFGTTGFQLTLAGGGRKSLRQIKITSKV